MTRRYGEANDTTNEWLNPSRVANDSSRARITQVPVRLPAWMVMSMRAATALAVLWFGAWWWIDWPNRTAHRFAALLANQDIEAVNDMLSHGPATPFRKVEIQIEDFENSFLSSCQSLVPRPRSLLDIVHGRAHFVLWESQISDQIWVERDRVAIEYGFGSESSWEYGWGPLKIDQPYRITAIIMQRN
jgi:hypothetical protein